MHQWGEADDIITFDGSKTSRPSAFASMDIAIWRAERDADVSILNTMGMSEKRMPGANYLAELNLGCRQVLSQSDERQLATLLANITEYAFANNLKLDWWERLAHPLVIPVFSNCTKILFAPSFAEPEFSWLETQEEPVKLLYVVPITERENHILAAHGVESFREYLHEEAVDLFSPRSDVPSSGAGSN